MSAATGPDGRERRLVIDIVSDVVCPWCYIGKRRLEAALDMGDRPRPEIRWHPFQWRIQPVDATH